MDIPGGQCLFMCYTETRLWALFMRHCLENSPKSGLAERVFEKVYEDTKFQATLDTLGNHS